jgi:HD superfamily phosphodiesterase
MRRIGRTKPADASQVQGAVGDGTSMVAEEDIAYAQLTRLLSVPRLASLYRVVKTRFQVAQGSAHNWEHVRRVVINAALFCEKEGANPDIVMAGAILHDIGFVLVPGDPRQHNVHGASGCHAFLGDWSPAQREAISRCILKHKGRFPGFVSGEPETQEEKVVCDADQVDKFGWVGLLQCAKVYAEYGMHGVERFQTLAGLAEGLHQASGIHLYTESARQFARRRAEPDLARAASRLEEELSLYLGWKD